MLTSTTFLPFSRTAGVILKTSLMYFVVISRLLSIIHNYRAPFD